MTARAKKGIGSMVIAVIVFVCLGAAFWPLTATRSGDPQAAEAREIVLVARDMAFYLPGNPTPNPPLPMKRGEEIALTLRNEEPGITHDFAIPSWGVVTKRLIGVGSDRIVFRVPDLAASVDYVCRPHAEMMFGKIELK